MKYEMLCLWEFKNADAKLHNVLTKQEDKKNEGNFDGDF